MRGLAVGIGGGLAIGILTSIAQGVLPSALSPLANSAGAWSLAAFVLALSERRPPRAALLGALALVAMVCGYAIATTVAGNHIGARGFIFWGAAAIVVGPVLGTGAAWVRGEDPLRAGLGVAAICGLMIGEAVYGLTVIAATTPAAYWAAQAALGAGLLLAMAARLRTLRTVVLMVASAALVAAAFYVVYSADLLSHLA